MVEGTPTKKEEDAISGDDGYDLKYSIRGRAISDIHLIFADFLFGKNKIGAPQG